MLNWTCTACNAFNTPRRETCWHCNNGRSTLPSSTAAKGTSKNWIRMLKIFRILGVVGAVPIVASLFLPSVIRFPPDGPMVVSAEYTTIYGQITAVIGLILLFFMVKPDLRKDCYILAIILAIITYFVSWLPVQISQAFDAITAELSSSGTETAVSIAGIGVSVVNLAVVLVIYSPPSPNFFARQKQGHQRKGFSFAAGLAYRGESGTQSGWVAASAMISPSA